MALQFFSQMLLKQKLIMLFLGTSSCCFRSVQGGVEDQGIIWSETKFNGCDLNKQEIVDANVLTFISLKFSLDPFCLPL